MTTTTQLYLSEASILSRILTSLTQEPMSNSGRRNSRASNTGDTGGNGKTGNTGRTSSLFIRRTLSSITCNFCK